MSPLLALLRSADGLRDCLLIGVDRKSSARSQNDAVDPTETWAAPDFRRAKALFALRQSLPSFGMDTAAAAGGT